jgi:hypothetical protein
VIIYHYQRSTNDFRFMVFNIKEYSGLLRVGHIGVGNKMRIMTSQVETYELDPARM